MGRSFHWMDREQVVTALDDIVDDDGSIVIANDSNLILPTTPWQQASQEIQQDFLPAINNMALHRKLVPARHINKYWPIHPSNR